MTKYLVVILVIVLVVYLLRRSAAKRVEAPRERRKVEDMVRCRVCGVNLPRSEALLSRGRIYCCDEHRRADERD